MQFICKKNSKIIAIMLCCNSSASGISLHYTVYSVNHSTRKHVTYASNKYLKIINTYTSCFANWCKHM